MSQIIDKSDTSTSLTEQRILVVFLSGIGNMVQFLPTLQAIRNKYPNAEIVLWVKEMIVFEVIKNCGLVDEVWPYYHKKFINLFRQLLVYLKLRGKKYDIIINTFAERGYKLRLFMLGMKAKVKLGYRVNNFTDYFYTYLFDYDVSKNESDNHFKIIEYLDDRVIKKNPDLCLQAKEQEFAGHFFAENNITKDKIVIGLHPGCSGFAHNKRWAPEKFAKVADIVCERYKAEIIILGGREEKSLGEEVAGYMDIAKPFLLAGKATILETAAVIEKCDLFISNDSGLMHIATAVNTPTVAIFGPTNAIKNTPSGTGHTIIRKELLCSPCLSYLGNGCKNIKCLKIITVEDVFAVVEKKLSSLTSLSR